MPDPNFIRIKRSNTTTNTPSSLLNGELASNISDQKLWIGNSSNTPILLSDITNTFVNQGAWDYNAAYNKNTVVTYAGIFYYSVSAVPPYNTSPNINTTYWAILSNPSGSSGGYLPLAGGAMTGSITSVGTTHDTEVAGDFFGVQLSADNTQGTMLNFDGLDTYNGASHMKVTPTGLTFPDSTTQTTAYTSNAGVSSLAAGTGISVDKTTGDITVTNSAPDQTVLLTNGAGISVTGTYPDFTIASTITQYTNTEARNSISSTATGLTYTSATGEFSLTASYEIPTTTSTTNWNSAYTQRLQWDGGLTNLVASTGRTSLGATTVGANMFTLTNPTAITFPRFNADNTVSALTAATFRTAIGAGTSSTTGTVTSVAALTLGTTGTDLASTVATGTTTPVITLNVPTASATNRGALSSTDWSNFNTAYTNRITSLTTTGSSGSATLTTNTLNVPTYTLAGLGGIKLTDLSSSATGLTYTNTTGVFSFTAGYSIPTTAKQTNWDTAYSSYLQWDGGATSLVAATGRASLGATTVGSNLFTLTNPSAVTFPRFNLDNTVTALDAATFRTAIGAGTSSTTGTVTSIATTSPITGGTITGTGTIGINAASANTASYVVQRDASGNFSAGTITATLSGNASTATSATSATTATTATNLAGGGAGQVPYNTASGATSFLAAGTAGQVLQSNATSAPSWANIGMPTGAIMPYAASSAPTGYLICDGTAVSRSTYASLFSVIAPSKGSVTITIASPGVLTLSAHGFQTGDIVYLTTTGALPTGLTANTLYYIINVTSSTFRLATSAANAAASTAINTSGTQSGTHTLYHCPYGLGDGSTTFNVPNLLQRIPLMAGSTGSGLTAKVMGTNYGTETETLTSSQIPAHSHPNTVGSNATATDGITNTMNQNNPHAHLNAVRAGSTGANYYRLYDRFANESNTLYTENTDVNHTHNIFINNANNTGGGGSHNNMQPSIALNFIIKT